MMKTNSWQLSSLIFIALFVTSAHSFAQKSPSKAYQIKAAFIYNFAKFVTWPDDAFNSSEQTLNFCILGESPFGNALDFIPEKTIHGRPLSLKFIDHSKDIRHCHILFSRKSKASENNNMPSLKKNKFLLTISDTTNFSSIGGIIEFVTVSKNIRFKINVDAAEKSGLKISSRLLELAISVRRAN